MKYTQLLQFAMRSVYIVAILFYSVSLIGQNWDRLDVDFRRDGKLLINSGVNGFVAPQFSNTDFNGDGKTDLFVFDRQSGVVMTFVWDDSGEEGRMEYAPKYALDFPPMINFAKLIDYDRDGDEDLFTFASMSPGNNIAHYRNEGTQSSPNYVLVKYPNADADVLNVRFSNGTYNEIYSANTDISAIADADGDGDIDILAFEQNSGSQVLFFQNQQVEDGLPQDSMSFVLKDLCWGKFLESGTASDITLSTSPNSCATGLVGNGKGDSSLRHAGSTMEVFDGNGDGLMDCLIGDLSNNSLVYLENGGTQENAWMISQNSNFPSEAERVDMPVFLSSFYVDVDADNVRELIVSQNTTNSGENTSHIWLYENEGTDASPVFKLKTKDFLYNTTLRIPEWSKPLFIDIDQDGLLDLLVGSYGYNSGSIFGDVRLFYFRNTGTTTNPSFIYETDDFLNISQFTNISRVNPTAGDLNGDGAIDILLGLESGDLAYFENQNAAGEPLEFGTGIFDYMGIDPGKEAKPDLIDLTGDGLLDLIIGENGNNTDPNTGILGGVSFYENVGTASEPMFVLPATTESLGGIQTKTIFTVSGSSDPVFFPTEDESEFMVLVGTNHGDVYLYDDVVDNLLDSFNLITDSIPVPRYGRQTGLDVADIDGDNYYEIAIGNENGGLAFHNTPFRVSIDNSVGENDQLKVSLYPNPTDDILNITSDLQPDSYQLVDAMGKVVKEKRLISSAISLKDIPAGFYVLKLRFGTVETSYKVVKN